MSSSHNQHNFFSVDEIFILQVMRVIAALNTLVVHWITIGDLSGTGDMLHSSPCFKLATLVWISERGIVILYIANCMSIAEAWCSVDFSLADCTIFKCCKTQFRSLFFFGFGWPRHLKPALEQAKIQQQQTLPLHNSCSSLNSQCLHCGCTFTLGFDGQGILALVLLRNLEYLIPPPS